MFINWLVVYLTIVISLVESNRPTIRLNFTPNEKFYTRDQQVEIQCELLNPTERTELPQLWHVDLKTKKRTPISRITFLSPNEDAPSIFKNNKNNRYEYVRKNSIRIRRLHMEDSARYECDCPDCEENIAKGTQELLVVQPAEPKWIIEPDLPLHENSRSTIKCVTEDFFPYVAHEILRDDRQITKDGRSSLSNGNAFPQKFVWEAAIVATSEWHNNHLRCVVTQGNIKKQITKHVEVLFTPRFLQCDERQYVDDKQEQAMLSCSYSGNPPPTLTWHRQNDSNPLQNQSAAIIEHIDKKAGKYQSLLKIDRAKFPSINNGIDELSTTFTVKLSINGIEQKSSSIKIVRNPKEARASSINSSSTHHYSSFLLFLFISFNLFQRH